MVEQVLAAHAGAAMHVCIVAPAEYARVGQVVREEVAQPVNAAACRPCLLAVSVQAVDGDDTAVFLAANAQTSNEKHTQRLDWGFLLPLVGLVQLQQLALLTLKSLKHSAYMLVRAKRKATYETYLRLTLLRANIQELSHRVISGQGQRVRGVGRRMCSSIVREGCREAELYGGCSMLAVEAIEDAKLLLSLAVRCSARSAHTACQPAERRLVGCRTSTAEARPEHHAVAIRQPYSHTCLTHCED
jgi:hypothetical protein